MAVRRAYDEPAKQRRREAILGAAERLFTVDHQLPTAARLAEEAGLAKGTLYLYFESREAVYASLLLARWCQALTELEDKVSVGTGSDAVEAVLESFVTLIDEKPVLMLLDAMLPQLKRMMPEEACQQFNQRLGEKMTQAGQAIERQLHLDEGRGFQLLVRSHAFARGLWQACDADGGNVSQHIGAPPGFSTELRDALREYWRGALPTR